MSPFPPVDPELVLVAREIRRADPAGERFARALRRTFDMLLDGQHTGRYRWDQLRKTEKTHCGTVVEINVQREFGFADGAAMDFQIGGVEVDCKYSQDEAGWMIPPEAYLPGHLLLGLWANDQKGQWSAGLVRPREEMLTAGNRDQKRQLTKDGKAEIVWLFQHAPLPENALLRLEGSVVERIFAQKSGQQRINMLFQAAQCRPISRAVVATVAQQEDYMKRVRGNGGARSALQPQGIVVLGQYQNHQGIARSLGLPVPGPGESLSVRLASRTAAHGDRAFAEIAGGHWVVADKNDPVEFAPLLPKI